MEKNKNRTDLLAAGRKKLQQFRQKKDGKGNSTKSSAKPSKSGRDTNEATDNAVATNDFSSRAGIPEILSIAGSSDSLPIEDSELNNSRLSQSADDGSSSLVPETKDDEPGASGSMIIVEKSEDSVTSLPTEILSEPERQHRKDLETDVGGAMQEVGSSSERQIVEGIMTQVEGDSKVPSDDLSETAGDNKTTESENPDASLNGLATSDVEKSMEIHGQSIVTSPLTDSGLVPTVSSVLTDKQREDILSASSNEKKTEMVNTSDGHAGFHTDGTDANPGFSDMERLSELKIDGTEKSLGCKRVDLSSVLDGTAVELSQLTGILRILNEDEFRFLVMSRELPHENFRDTDEIKAHKPVDHDALEKLKEQLYVTSFSKDVFHLQLCEQQTVINEIRAVNASLAEVQVKNELFAEEIVQCRNELQEVVSEREELRKQLHSSKAEVEGFSTKVDELQKNMEMSQAEISNLLSELVDCRNLVKSLQGENENLNGSLNMMAEERNKVFEENGVILHENEKMAGELFESKAYLDSLKALLRGDQRHLEEKNDSMASENSKLHADLENFMGTVEALKTENRRVNEILSSVSEEGKKLKEEKEFMAHQIESMSKTLQSDVSNLNGNLSSVNKEKIKLEEEREIIFSEYEKQFLELVESKILEAVLQAECRKVVNDLKEAASHINQLTKENGTIIGDLEFHKLKPKEYDSKDFSSQFQEVANRGDENDIYTLQKPKSGLISQEELGIFDVSSGFVALKRRLDDAEIVMQKLDKEMEGLHLHLTFLNSSSDKVVSPGVSKLIQAFEPRRSADDHDPEKSPLSENLTNEDPYARAMMMADNLRKLLKGLVDDSKNAGEFCMAMQNKLLNASAASGTDRREYDSLREHTDQVEQENIELMVLYEAMREHRSHAVRKQGELLSFSDSLKKQEVDLTWENRQLKEKLNGLQAKISELQSQLDVICRDSVAGRESVNEEEWDSFCARVIQAVSTLDSIINTFSTNSLAGGDSNLDIAGLVAASIDGATKMIVGLQGQLAASHRECQEISDRNDMALHTLHTLYIEISELVSKTTTENDVVDDKVLDLAHHDVFNTLLDQIRRLCGEGLRLESENKQLSSELMSTAMEANELKKRCLESDNILRLVKDIEQSVSLEGVEIDADEPAVLLESLIHLLIQKYKEANQYVNSSTSLEMQLKELQGQVEHLNHVLVHYENENLVFKQSLKSAEEGAIALSSKVQEKVAELEMSEQRVLSLREKLSIAVTKGKGLISQRDSLKQSLAEVSRELEKSSQELLSKDAWLHELETKLQVYSEAGDRTEALESELSYIRNSATALRESFLLKDSVLQRIEEILEDLELPDDFHSRDIIEKIEWLAKSLGGNSMPLGDWDRRSSVVEGSYPDTGFVGADGLKEDTQQHPYSHDDLRIRYEELQNKVYVLAEQNDMLEQSLLERNNIVQRWEEILDRIDVPSQLRSMEPEYKIQWMGSAFSEAQNRCYSLQQKIDDLQTLCESLTAYVEDSQRRTPGLVSAFQQSCVENEILSLELEILSHDNDVNSENAVVFKMRNENLQNEVIMLQEQKLHVEEDIRRTEDAIKRLRELVSDALQESMTEDVLNQEGVEYFEEILRKLVENYKTLSLGKPVNIDPSDVHITEQSSTSRDFEQELVTLNKNLEDSMGELMCLREERDNYMANNQSMLHKVEDLKTRNEELQDLLNLEEHKSRGFEKEVVTLSKNLEDSMGELICMREERNDYMVNNQSLLRRVEDLETKKEELQDLLNQEECKSRDFEHELVILSKKQEDSIGEMMRLGDERENYKENNQSLLHKVEDLETKKKELQDLLNQEERKSWGFEQELLTLRKNLEDSMGELMRLGEERENYKVNNQSLLHKVEDLETKMKELQDLLNQEEHKSWDFEQELVTLRKNLEDSMGELLPLREEVENNKLNNQSLLHKVEELETEKKELQDLLNKEEQKSGSLREKLNVAVRKGKSLVQQRDGMKQVIEELNAEVERLKSEANHSEKAFSGYEEQMKDLVTAHERVQVMESENSILRDRMEKNERHLQEKEGSWSSILVALNEIDIGLACDSGNPIEKLTGIGKCVHDLRTGMGALEQEARKSKRAADLLLTELNEVQERNDGLQEELAKAVHELSEVSRERDLAQNARTEALAQVEKLSYIHSEENDRQLSEIMLLKSGVDNMKEDLSAVEGEMGDVLSKDLEVLHNMKAMMKSFSEFGGTLDFSAPFHDGVPGGIMSKRSQNKVFMTEISSLRERLYNHSHLLQKEASGLYEVLMNLHREYTSQKESCESMNLDVEKLKVIEKEKESESHVLRGNISRLYDSCTSAILEIENWKDRVAGNISKSSTPEGGLKSQIHIPGGNSISNDVQIFDEQSIRSTCEKLLLLVGNFISMQSEHMDGGQREMKSAIADLQKELQEKDIQRERICVELVNQIKESEKNSKNYLHDLQKTKAHLHDSKRELEARSEENKVLEQRLKELQHHETNSNDLEQKVNSLTGELAAKSQETEELMQALDEQESEMEDLAKKIGGLENELRQKNQELESLEASRAKALKKHSVTVSKFDELHHFSENLLAEVEKLQSQLQEKDGEISFLRQEVTRCTNDELAVTQLSKKRGSDEILGLLSWLDSLLSRVQVDDMASSDDSKSLPVDEYKEVLQQKTTGLISELESLRVVAQNSDMLLREERCKVEEFSQKEQYLKDSLSEKESELATLQGAIESGKATNFTSEIVEADQMSNKWGTSSGTIAPQVRSLRKSNNDQVAIAIDVDHTNDRLEDVDDDKAHGFKSLTTSKIVPRFTRPISDLVDGVWMSCDRALMRQPTLRLGLIIYWALLHAMLTTFVV